MRKTLFLQTGWAKIDAIPKVLLQLFYPPGVLSYEDVTPAEAAKQLRLYLTTNHHEWELNNYDHPRI